MSTRDQESLEDVLPKSGPSTKEIIAEYVSYLPLFIISLIGCVLLGIVYLKYATPKYNVATSILIKTDLVKSSANGNASEDLVTTILNGGKEVLLDNEVALIKSTSLMQKVVIKNQFNITYFPLDKFKKNELYHNSPIKLIPQDFDSCKPFAITVKDINAAGAVIIFGNDKGTSSLSYKWNEIFKINGKRFILIPANNDHELKGSYLVNWASAESAADEILDNLSVDVLDKKTTILQIQLVTDNINRGEDILNALWKEYIMQNTEDKNAISQNTIHFIDDRLQVISQELSGVEGNLEDYQGNNQLVNVQSQSTQSLTNANEVSKDITGLSIQQGVVDMLQNYFSNPDTENTPVPSNLGINDPTLASLVLKYNELQIKKIRETPLLTSNSLILQDLNNQLNGLKKSIIENLQNIKKNLQLQELSLQQKNQQYNKFISALPHKERVIQTIKRKQSITEGLYLYLLQKREEAVISASTSNVSNYKQIDMAKGSDKPVQPKASLVKILSVLMGLLIPISWIRLRKALNDKVTTRSDITNRVKIPVLGEVTHLSKIKIKSISAITDATLGEEFRKIRTNISLFQKQKSKQVILVTSSASGEGKTMIAENLAAIFAMPGKKVALLNFDFAASADGAATGLTDYLNGDTNALSKISSVSGDIPTLHLYPSGREISNPSDLLLKSTLPELFNTLKQNYEYIIVDTAATTIASDAFVLAEYADVVLFVVREKVTSRTQIDSLRESSLNDKLSNTAIIVNDIRGKGRFI